MLNLRRLGYSLRLYESAATAPPPAPTEPRPSAASPAVPDLTFQERPLMAIDGASDPVVRLAIFHWQQPHDHIRPQRNTHLWPTPRHHDRLTNSEPMSRHGGYLGWHRIENNGGCRLPSEPVGRPERRALSLGAPACERLHTATVARVRASRCQPSA